MPLNEFANAVEAYAQRPTYATVPSTEFAALSATHAASLDNEWDTVSTMLGDDAEAASGVSGQKEEEVRAADTVPRMVENGAVQKTFPAQWCRACNPE